MQEFLKRVFAKASRGGSRTAPTIFFFHFSFLENFLTILSNDLNSLSILTILEAKFLMFVCNFVSKRFFSRSETVLKRDRIFLDISPNIKLRWSGAVHLPELSCSRRLSA